MGINKILIPTDGSVFSRRAGKIAIEVAKAANAALIAIHVIVVSQPDILEAAKIEKIKSRRAEACFKDLEEDAKRAGVIFETKMLISRNIHQTIIEEIELQNPDIVVIGSHGLTGLKKILLGSVTKEVLRMSTAPVLVVK